MKNIRVFKGVPTSQIGPLMAVMSNSLGVGCDYCHDLKDFASDAKDEKGVARSMVAMVRDINTRHFEGEQSVTCYTCHHGSPHVHGVPQLADAYYNRPATTTPAAKPALPPASQVIATLEKTQKTITEAHGTMTRSDGVTEPFTFHDGKVETKLEYPPEADEALRPISINRDRATVTRTETVNGKQAYVLEQKRERLYVDTQTGALLRRHQERDTEIGPVPEETDYNGKTIVWSRGDVRVTFKLE